LGLYPRVSIISPTWSAQDLIQVLGRIYRAKAKTKVLQRIIFCKDTVEDEVCGMIQSKVANIAFINDGTMDSYKIEGITDKLMIPNGIEKITDNLISNQENKFGEIFNKVSKLYERKITLQKELDLINKEINQSEGLLNSMY
jgi:superfamily II DNA or RNA helicase